jgi:hypothetical protein
MTNRNSHNFHQRAIAAIRRWLIAMPAPFCFLAFIGLPNGREDTERLIRQYREGKQ